MTTTTRVLGPGTAGRLDDFSPGWLIAIGVLFLALGVFALLAPAVSSVSGTALVAISLIAAGGLQLAAAFRSATGWSRAGRLALGVLAIATGVWAFANPVEGTITLTFALAAYLLGSGLIRFITGLTLKDEGDEHAGWMIAGALLSLVLAMLIMFELPSSSLWAIGLVIGVELASHGVHAILLGLDARRGAPARRR